MDDKKYCPWCQDKSGKTDLGFSVLDDDFAQWVHIDLIKFCPFCGRELKN